MWVFVCTLCLFAVYACLIIYYRWGWINIPEFTPVHKPANSYTISVSVIVPARNESANIISCIRSIMEQSYPNALMELVIVDDHSTDDTARIVMQYVSAYSNIHLIQLNETLANMAYKKRAIEMGIARATGTLIVTTDADCTHDKRWIETMVQFHEKYQAQFIAAPVKFLTKNDLLSVFQTLDFMVMQGITGASVYKKIHTMCNGANLAYTRDAFYAVNGFKGIDNIPTGDDMLLMHKIYQLNPERVMYLKSKSAIATTRSTSNWKDFFQQRIRWASKATHYEDKRIFFVLLLVYLLNVCCFFLLIFSFWKPYWGLLSEVLLCKTMVELFFLHPVAVFFNEQKWLWWFPFLQPLHIGYVIVSGWLGKFGKYQWKGRVVTPLKNEN